MMRGDLTICYIGIGSNLGDRRSYIDRALEAVKNMPCSRLRRVSSIYETDPVGDVEQGKFLNGVIEVETTLKPKMLLKELTRIEGGLGRVRSVKNGPRTIDLDILYYGEEFVRDKDLTIPHPRIDQREFVLKGLRELGRV